MKKAYCQFLYSLEKLITCFDFLFIHSFVFHLIMTYSFMQGLVRSAMEK